MKTTQLRFLTLGILLSTLGLPHAAWAIQGCGNGSLKGIYDAQSSNLGLQSALKAANPAKTGTDTAQAAGFGSNPSSLSGNQTGMGRYYLDGNGNVVGLSSGARAFNVVIGTYTINSDCTGSISLKSGAAFDVVLVDAGKNTLFVRTDGAGAGDMGTLTRSGACGTLNSASSFGFSISGASPNDDATLGPLSSVGTLTLQPNGTFSMKQTNFVKGAVQRATAAGTYTLNADCTFSLKFNATGNSANFVAPTVTGILVDRGQGLVTVQPATDNTISGTLVAQ